MQDSRTKASIRKELLGKRDAIPPEVRSVKNRLIIERLLGLDEIRNAGVIFLFASFRSEVDTSGVMRQLLGEGKRVVLPVVDREGHRLLLYEIKDVAELSAGYMGIPEPSVRTEEKLADINEVDAAVVPGAAFDPIGNRIGYGGGYYDILLSGLREKIPVIAIAYEEQVADSIPSEPHDIKVDLIVTDRRTIRTISGSLPDRRQE
jgi:5-formyltetrahydrofolate cyclo-ligase